MLLVKHSAIDKNYKPKHDYLRMMKEGMVGN
jgi:hypothetical protein